MPLTQLPAGLTPFGSPVGATPKAQGRGKTFYVSSVADLRADESSQGDTALRPFATLDYAIGQCTANRGDVIVVMENHAETLTAASAVNFDLAGITVIGLGNGDDRPTFTFTTAAAANVLVGAANIELTNLVFLSNLASQTTMITINGSGDGANIHHNEFREGTATHQASIIMTGVADDVRIEDNYFYEPTAGNGDYAIQIAAGGAPARLKINRNFIYGDYDLAGIGSTNAFTEASICDNRVVNLQAGQFAIEFTGASTGILDRNFVGTDARATALDPGSMYVGQNPWNATGDFVAVDALPAADSTTNFIGIDDADNDAATTSVVANRDGSILERLEDVALNTPRIVSHAKANVTGGTAWTTANSPVAVFSVTGAVLARCWGVVSTAMTSTGATGTIALGVSNNTGIFIAATTIDGTNAAVTGQVWVDSTPVTFGESLPLTGNWVAIGGGFDIFVTIATNNMSAGGMTVYCQFLPTVASASVADSGTA